ncbi:YusW family protein [Alkalihalobacterium elongatum]|uniref:YusW family protein n=1 Tax=Alkalihalobacterium elongatum TaxID=2675466 RepID=UPI001C1F22A0|nr:YusW family protein [Alkalihalobacterium elongatum]
MGKFGYMLIGALFTLILSFSYLVLADSFNADPYYKDTSTTVMSEDEYDTFHDNQKDELEETVVVQEEPVFIAANHQEIEVQFPVSNKNNNEGALTSQDEIQEVIKEDIDGSETKQEISAKQGEPSSFLNHIEKLEIKIKNDDFEVKIKQEQKKKKDKAEVEIKNGKEKMKIKGEKAEEFLLQTFSKVQLNSPEDLQQVVKNIITAYGYDWDSVEVEIKVESKDDNKYEYKHKK